ncbi:hypothetical protein GALL_193930 [mine drainage metagenome]|uniref:ORC1/DEAH AAA+ ATPase domain-containing protein n=1 Tax=mine drainage metagenome TaxID=410659 RepID=A0A1J5RQJ6_9ZZZZ
MNIHSLTNEQRLAIISEHPVVTKDYLIITPVITDVYSIIRERVLMRTTGTFMFASPRMGKSTCARAIRHLLQAEFPKIFIMSFVAEKRRIQEAALFTDILQADGLSVTRGERYPDIQRKLITHIQSRLAMVGGNQFVLMIDEMQNLGDAELEKLATIHNRLEEINIRMTTIGFGQPEILEVRSSLSFLNKTYLISRFLCEPIPFHGCATKEDLEIILEDYDHTKFYPTDSDLSFTRFFLIEAFDNGFRLRQYATPIWKALKKAAGVGTETIPMEHLSRTVEYLLVLSQQHDNKDFQIDSKFITSAVNASNLSYFSGLINEKSYH